jgi:hypothetical protein
MKHEISVHKAQGYKDRPVNDLEIKAEKELPEYDHIDVSYTFFRNDANMIFQGLISCLPGGTVDQLLLLLLEHMGSQFRVPYGKFINQEKEEETNHE